MKIEVNRYEAKYIRLSSKIGTPEVRGKTNMAISESVDDMPETMSELFFQFEDSNFGEQDILKFIFENRVMALL